MQHFYLCHRQSDILQKCSVTIPVVQSETEPVHILLQVYHGNMMECTQPHFGQTYPSLYFTDTMKFIASVSSRKRLVNSKYVSLYMLYVLITKILFFRKKTKSKVDKSDFKYYKNGCWF